MKTPNKVLSPGELEIMSVLWDRGRATAREVVEQIRRSRETAYTTIQTQLNILARKGHVEVERGSKAHHFVPKLTRIQAQANALREFVRQFFDTEVALAQHVISSGRLDELELEALRKLLDTRAEEMGDDD